jgi:hypothetical protein
MHGVLLRVMRWISEVSIGNTNVDEIMLEMRLSSRLAQGVHSHRGPSIINARLRNESHTFTEVFFKCSTVVTVHVSRHDGMGCI